MGIRAQGISGYQRGAENGIPKSGFVDRDRKVLDGIGGPGWSWGTAPCRLWNSQ